MKCWNYGTLKHSSHLKVSIVKALSEGLNCPLAGLSGSMMTDFHFQSDQLDPVDDHTFP